MSQKEHQPGFTYLYSEILQQEIAISHKTGWVYCQDGTKYSPEELKLLKKIGGDIPLQVHILKNQFKGSITPDSLKN